MENDDNHLKIIVDKMLLIAGYDETYEDMVEEGEGWQDKRVINEEQMNEFEKWYVDYVCEQSGDSKKRVEKDFAWFNLSFGLKEI